MTAITEKNRRLVEAIEKSEKQCQLLVEDGTKMSRQLETARLLLNGMDAPINGYLLPGHNQQCTVKGPLSLLDATEIGSETVGDNMHEHCGSLAKRRNVWHQLKARMRSLQGGR